MMEVKLCYTRCTIEQSFHLWLVPFFSGSKRSQSWKESRKMMWGKIFTVRRLACKTCFVTMNTYQTVFMIHDVVQAPCEFSFLDMGPSKCKGVEQNQAPGLSLLGFPWWHKMQYGLLIWTWWMQVIQDTNFNLLKSFLEKFTVCFPTAKEAQASVLLLVGGFNPSRIIYIWKN